MSTCRADIKQMGQDEILSYFTARVNEWLASGRFETQEDVVAKVNEEMAALDEEGAWSAKCGCGWQGNDPYPSKATALASLEKHYAGVRNG